MTEPTEVTVEYRTEFAIDGVWYTNALRFADPQEAREEAVSRFARWTMPVAWRVVDDRMPQKQPYQPWPNGEDPTAFKIGVTR